uniref:Major facilitator superfamily (MFS) profile domain-containing protein n=1 Tax=Pogona vitticeps TaxID=103695 RepID=A0ABM5F2L2_9SAUR
MEGLRSVLVQYQKLLQMILVLGIGGNLSIGYQISVINYPSVYIRRFMNETWMARTGSPLHEKTLLFLWSFIVSVYGAGGLLGSLCCGHLTVKYGKKKSLLCVDVLVAGTALLVGYSRRAKSFEMLMVGRFLYGVAAGFCLTIHPQYAGEISPKRLRGFANATSGFFWSLGKCLGQILGLRECLGTESSWPWLLAFTGATALVQLTALPFFPESPPHLLIEKGDEGACLRGNRSGGVLERMGLPCQGQGQSGALPWQGSPSAPDRVSPPSPSPSPFSPLPKFSFRSWTFDSPFLGAEGGGALSSQHWPLSFFPSPPLLPAMDQLWGSGDHREELDDLKKEAGAEGKGRRVQSPRELLRDGSQRRQLRVLLAAVATLQLCGINAVYFYASEVFRRVGFAERLLPYLALGLGFCELSASVLCVLTIERFGRRSLLWKGCGLMALGLLLFTVSLTLQNKYPLMSYCSVTLLFLFVFIFGVGPNGATMAVMMEIFRQSSRPAAFVMGGCLNWAGLFALGITFPFAVESLGPFCFLIFTAVLLGTSLFFYLFLPETKGKSIAEITEEFEGFQSIPFGKKLPAFLGRGLQEDQSVYSTLRSSPDPGGSPGAEMEGSSLRDLLQYPRLLQMMLVLGIGGSLQLGFQASMITYASVHVKTLINETSLERSGLPVAPRTLTLLWSLIVSIFGLGGLLGSMASGRLTTKYGKKSCLLGNNLLMVASAFLLGLSKAAKSYEMLLAGRFLCGLSAGMCALLHSQYLGEVSPKRLRGCSSSTASIFWSLGKVMGQVLGQSELLGSARWWPLLMAFGGIAATIQLLTLPFFPESPPHLFLNKGDEEGCLKAMKTLWGEKHHHQEELEDLRKEQAAQQSSRSRGILEVAKEPSLRWQMYILLLSGVTLQLSGIQAVELGRPFAPPEKALLAGKTRGELWGKPNLSLLWSHLPCLESVPSPLGPFVHPRANDHLLSCPISEATQGSHLERPGISRPGQERARLVPWGAAAAARRSGLPCPGWATRGAQDGSSVSWPSSGLGLSPATLCPWSGPHFPGFLPLFPPQIYAYTFEVLSTAGFHPDDIPYLSLGVSTSELFSAVLCTFIIERSGRKVLLWGGYGLMATVLALLTLTLSLQHRFFWMPYCSLSLIFWFVICFGLGPAGAMSSVRMEIFDQTSRASAFVISGILNWIGFFVMGMAFPFIVESFQQFSFLIFMGALYASGLLFYLFLPETKQKSILEIQEEFNKLNFKTKRVVIIETSVVEKQAFCTKL